MAWYSSFHGPQPPGLFLFSALLIGCGGGLASSTDDAGLADASQPGDSSVADSTSLDAAASVDGPTWSADSGTASNDATGVTAMDGTVDGEGDGATDASVDVSDASPCDAAQCPSDASVGDAPSELDAASGSDAGAGIDAGPGTDAAVDAGSPTICGGITGACFVYTGTGTGYPYGIAVDATRVYFTVPAQNALVAVPIDGGAATTLASTSSPLGVAVNDTAVYWTSQAGSLTSLTLAGASVTTLSAAAPAMGATNGVVLDADNVYWTATGPPIRREA